jgi:transposase-like protein
LKRYDLETRQKAVTMMEDGYGKHALSSALAMPVGIAEKWIHTYRAVGKEAFLDMGSNRRHYDYETKLAAARDFVDLGMTRQEVMSKHGIANLTQLKNWAKAYREGGPEALRPKPKGRPRKNSGGLPEPKTREQELEAENRRLRAEVAYLKKLRALEAAKRAPGRNAR